MGWRLFTGVENWRETISFVSHRFHILLSMLSFDSKSFHFYQSISTLACHWITAFNPLMKKNSSWSEWAAAPHAKDQRSSTLEASQKFNSPCTDDQSSPPLYPWTEALITSANQNQFSPPSSFVSLGKCYVRWKDIKCKPNSKKSVSISNYFRGAQYS